MDDDEEYDDDEDKDIKPSLVPEVKPKIADMTPEARADCKFNPLRTLYLRKLAIFL